VFGVEAASKRYFHKSAAQLTTAESALLAAVLPAPKRFSVIRPSGYLRARQAWIMAQMPDVDTGSVLMH
jgi:monofunctional biosynthetic peptidoglycan transglycosylase